MRLFSWNRKITTRKSRRVCPTLEMLEDRLVPTTSLASAPLASAPLAKVAEPVKAVVSPLVSAPAVVSLVKPVSVLTGPQRTALDRADAALALIDRLTTSLKVADAFEDVNAPPEKLGGATQNVMQQLRDMLAADGVPTDMLNRLFGPAQTAMLAGFGPASPADDPTQLVGQPGWSAAPDLMAFRSAADARMSTTSVEQSLPDQNGTVTIKYSDCTVYVLKDGTVTYEFNNGDEAYVAGDNSYVSETHHNADGTTTHTETQNKGGTYSQSTTQIGGDGKVIFRASYVEPPVGPAVAQRSYPGKDGNQGIQIMEFIDKGSKRWVISVDGKDVFDYTMPGGSTRGIKWCPAPDVPDIRDGAAGGSGWIEPTPGLLFRGLADPADEHGGVVLDLDRFARSLAAYLNSKVNPSPNAPAASGAGTPFTPPGGKLPDPPAEPSSRTPAPKPTVGPTPMPPTPGGIRMP